MLQSLFAASTQSYFSGFIDHWSKVFSKQGGVVMLAVGVGAVALFIITRGKWKK
jgi:hypothetical protein